MPGILWYEGYVTFDKIPGWNEVNRKIPFPLLQGELNRAKYRTQLRKDIKKAIAELKRKAKKVKPVKRNTGKVAKVMGEFKRGTLHSGSKSGPKVSSRKQAVAIAMSEAKRGKKK